MNIENTQSIASKTDNQWSLTPLIFVTPLIFEFQLRDPVGLQNVIKAPYIEFVPDGKTGAGFSEWNYPAINSTNIINPRVRVLK